MTTLAIISLLGLQIMEPSGLTDGDRKLLQYHLDRHEMFHKVTMQSVKQIREKLQMNEVRK